jgi:hypothetical protein
MSSAVIHAGKPAESQVFGPRPRSAPAAEAAGQPIDILNLKPTRGGSELGSQR